MGHEAEIIAPKSGGVYYTGNYWNDFPAVQKVINLRATGDSKLAWYDHFFLHHKKPFKKVLILNCGNGWVERLLYEKGYIAETVGVDYAEDLLHQARDESKGLPFRYFKMDINSAKFPESGFDLVINHAAAHHMAKVNKIFRELARIMTNDGIFLNYDYVGPHRNQYNVEDWQAAYEVNN